MKGTYSDCTYGQSTKGSDMRFNIFNLRVLNGVSYFDFTDTELGLEFCNWRLVKRKAGGYFVASPGEAYSVAGQRKTKDFIRAADLNRNVKGVAWLSGVLEAALTAHNAERQSNPAHWTQEDWDRHNAQQKAPKQSVVTRPSDEDFF
jgi:hypothetical protein